MPLGRSLLVAATVAAFCSSCVYRTTTTSLPPVPAPGPRLAAEVTLSAGGETSTGKITALRGDTVVFLPAPYWGQDPRMYPLDTVTALQTRRAGRAGPGYLYGFVAGFTVIGALAASEARYDEDYSSGLAAASLFGLVITGPVGAGLFSGRRITIYQLPAMSVEDRRELVRRLMASDGEEARWEEGSW